MSPHPMTSEGIAQLKQHGWLFTRGDWAEPAELAAVQRLMLED